MTTTDIIDIRRAQDRAATKISWLDSKHSFSFGGNYDPANTHHGLLLVNNDDTVKAAAGFETHPHRDMEIITWVLRGSLVHQDSTGHSGVIYPGLAQRMSAGRGIMHSEKNDSWTLTGEASHAEPVHFVQMWVQPGDSVELPQAPYLHLFVPRGDVVLEGAGPLHEGDAVRFTASGGQRITATEPSEILIWEMHANLAAA